MLTVDTVFGLLVCSLCFRGQAECLLRSIVFPLLFSFHFTVLILVTAAALLQLAQIQGGSKLNMMVAELICWNYSNRLLSPLVL